MARDFQEYQRVQNEQPHLVAGAGTAAVLLFLHIALAGYLGYAIVQLFLNSGGGVVWTGNLVWQYFVPAWLAMLTYFPSDSLTRTVARVAFVAGCAALGLAGAVALRESQLGTMTLACLAACGVAVLLAELFRSGLPKARSGGRIFLPPLVAIPILRGRLVLLVAVTAWTVAQAMHGGAILLLAGIGGLLLLWRVAFEFRYSTRREP